MKYIIFPGYVTSKNDGDSHWISAPQLMRLYGVAPVDCLIFDDRVRFAGYPPHLIALRPRRDGNYALPAPAPAAKKATR